MRMTLGEMIVMLEDLAKRTTRSARDQHRLAALWVAVNLLDSGNEKTLRRLATAG